MAALARNGSPRRQHLPHLGLRLLFPLSLEGEGRVRGRSWREADHARGALREDEESSHLARRPPLTLTLSPQRGEREEWQP